MRDEFFRKVPSMRDDFNHFYPSLRVFTHIMAKFAWDDHRKTQQITPEIASVYGHAAVKSSPCTAASPSNMTSTKAQDE